MTVAARCRRSASRATRIKSWPRAAKPRARARPMPLDPPVTSTMGRGARATDPGVIAAATPTSPFARVSPKDYRFGQRAIGKGSLPAPRLLRLEVAVLDPIAGLEAETLGRATGELETGRDVAARGDDVLGERHGVRLDAMH